MSIPVSHEVFDAYPELARTMERLAEQRICPHDSRTRFLLAWGAVVALFPSLKRADKEALWQQWRARR